MSVWQITGFQDAGVPHWDIAIIEAPSPEAAVDILEKRIGTTGDDDFDRPETVWAVTDRSEWRVMSWGGVFILGGGCR